MLKRFGEYDKLPKRKSKISNFPPIPDCLDWLVWRLIINKISTLQEINEHYDLVDVLDANMALDWQIEVENHITDSVGKK